MHNVGDIMVKASNDDSQVEVFIITEVKVTESGETYNCMIIKYHKNDDEFYILRNVINFDSSFKSHYMKPLEKYMHFLIKYTFELTFGLKQ